MKLELTVPRIVELLKAALRAEAEVADNALELAVERPGAEPEVISVSLADLGLRIEELEQKEIGNEAIVYDARSYEVLVREESPLPLSRFRGPSAFPFSLYDADNGIRYTLGWATDCYLLYVLEYLSDAESVQYFWRPPIQYRRLPEQIDLLSDTDAATGSKSPFDLLRESQPRLLTLQVNVERDRSLSQLQSSADAFLFHLGYNLDTSFVPLRSLEELARRSRIRRMRRMRLEELDPPRRVYGANLVYHYQMGVSTDNALLEFLSYYHVAESFFDDVFHDDLIESVKDALTRPNFSYRRKSDIKKLVNHIKRRLRVRNESVVFSEEEALRLTLERFVDLVELCEGLNVMDSSLIPYYRGTKVPFSDGDSVDLSETDNDQTFTRLARRIYRTRNAVVHSKEGERLKYVPFRDDRDLIQEVPLVRLIAEQIIIKSANTQS